MATLTNENFIYEAMNRHGWKFFRVLDTAGRTLDIQEIEDLHLDRSIDLLKETLSNLSGPVTVIISEKSVQGKGRGGNVRNQIEYNLNLTGPGLAADTGRTIGGFDQDFLNQQIAGVESRLKAEFTAQQEINDLKRQITDLKTASIWEKYLPDLVPVVIGMFTKQAPAIAGHGETIPAEDQQADWIKLNQAINRLKKADPDFLQHLEKLADLAETKPAVYKMAIEQLNNI